MAAVTLLAAYPLNLLMSRLLLPHLLSVPWPWRTLLTTGLLVGLLTYGVMPILTRLLSAWLFRPGGTRAAGPGIG